MSSERDTRQRLLEAAGELFSRKGFDGTTTKEICERAGVNIASVNYYFGSKENLYVEAVKAAMPSTIHTISKLQWPEGTPAEQKLRDYIHEMVRHIVGQDVPPWKQRLVMREMASPRPACEAYFRRHVQVNFSKLLEIVDELVPPTTPLHRKYQFALSVVGQCIHYRVASRIIRSLVPHELFRTYFDADHLARHISEVCLAALGLIPPLLEQWDGRREDGRRRSVRASLTAGSAEPAPANTADRNDHA